MPREAIEIERMMILLKVSEAETCSDKVGTNMKKAYGIAAHAIFRIRSLTRPRCRIGSRVKFRVENVSRRAAKRDTVRLPASKELDRKHFRRLT